MSSPAETGSSSIQGATSKRSLGDLVSDVSLDVSQLVRTEIELAKAEIKEDVTHAGKGAGMFAGAAVFGLYGLGLLWLGLAGVIAIWLPWWAGLLIMAGVMFVVTGILALVGRGQVTQVQGKPQRAIREGKETVETVKAAAKPTPRATALEPAGSATGAAAPRTPALESSDR